MTELEGWTRGIAFVAVIAGAGVLYFLDAIRDEVRGLRRDLLGIGYQLADVQQKLKETTSTAVEEEINRG